MRSYSMISCLIANAKQAILCVVVVVLQWPSAHALATWWIDIYFCTEWRKKNNICQSRSKMDLKLIFITLKIFYQKSARKGVCSEPDFYLKNLITKHFTRFLFNFLHSALVAFIEIMDLDLFFFFNVYFTVDIWSGCPLSEPDFRVPVQNSTHNHNDIKAFDIGLLDFFTIQTYVDITILWDNVGTTIPTTSFKKGEQFFISYFIMCIKMKIIMNSYGSHFQGQWQYIIYCQVRVRNRFLFHSHYISFENHPRLSLPCKRQVKVHRQWISSSISIYLV